MSYFSEEILGDARQHALAEFPYESCGIVVNDSYIAMTNVAGDPEKHIVDDVNCPCTLCAFKMDPEEVLEETIIHPLQGVIHSHPSGNRFPSQADMQSQIETDVPWGIVVTDGERCSDVTEWGDSLPIAPLVGRKFMHGVSDCYSLIRDVFKLGREGCLAQDVDWPLEPAELSDFPRDDAWWAKGGDLYSDHFVEEGFYEINIADVRPGDCFLCAIPHTSPILNHAGVLLNGDLILHHLPGETRISRREPVGGWGRVAEKWVRFDPKRRVERNA